MMATTWPAEWPGFEWDAFPTEIVEGLGEVDADSQFPRLFVRAVDGEVFRAGLRFLKPLTPAAEEMLAAAHEQVEVTQ